jgi:general secretion pathway protein I
LFQSRPFKLETARFGDENASSGFTLIEALVSLAVAAVCLSAIGALMASNIRVAGRIDQHLGLVETLRAVETGLPDRISLLPGNLTGEMAGNAWAVDASPFSADAVNPRAAEFWIPQLVVMKVRSPSGSIVEVDTIRLRRRNDR